MTGSPPETFSRKPPVGNPTGGFVFSGPKWPSIEDLQMNRYYRNYRYDWRFSCFTTALTPLPRTLS
ncbi:conserved hypothetical protein [Pseudomonas sp. 8Z]|nr:conserved hypothetical protein [Pseudomonas sp. 8Z]